MVVQGREVHDLYILTRGAGDVRVAVPDAPPRVVSRISAPGIFGEMGMLTGEPRRATVVAVGEVECWRLGKERFREVLAERPAIAEGVSRLLAAREVELSSATENLSEAARRHRLESEHGSLLERIERFFGLAGTGGERERDGR
jgi:CRP-like cAMP-binding protein